MKALITGAGGQVGRALLTSVPAGVTAIACTHRELDVTDESAVHRYVSSSLPAVIVNASAYTMVDRAEVEPSAAYVVNARAPLYLAQAAHEARARLIHLSTDFVFDGTSALPYAPDATPNPLNHYGLSKWDGEKAVLGERPADSVILRTSWVYAPVGRNFVNTLLKVFREHARARVVMDQVGSPTSAMSVASAVWKIVQMPALHGIHHWTDDGIASWYDFAVAIAEEGAALRLAPQDVDVVPITSRDYPTNIRRPAYSVLDKTSLATLDIPRAHWRVRLREALREIANG